MIGSDEREIRCRDSGAAAIAMAPRPWRGRQCVAAGLMGADSHASLTGESRHSELLELPRVDAVLLHLEVQRNTQPLVNALKHEKKLAVLAALVEGNSIRAAGKSSRTIRRAPAPDELLKPIYVNVRSNSEKLTAVDRSGAVDRVTEPIEAGHLTLTEVCPCPGERLEGVNHKTQGPSLSLIPVDENRLPPREAGPR